jgi:hypothetical protein
VVIKKAPVKKKAVAWGEEEPAPSGGALSSPAVLGAVAVAALAVVAFFASK